MGLFRELLMVQQVLLHFQNVKDARALRTISQHETSYIEFKRFNRIQKFRTNLYLRSSNALPKEDTCKPKSGSRYELQT